MGGLLIEFLRFMAAISSACRLLACMRVLAALVDVQLAQHVAAQRARCGTMRLTAGSMIRSGKRPSSTLSARRSLMPPG